MICLVGLTASLSCFAKVGFKIRDRATPHAGIPRRTSFLPSLPSWHDSAAPPPARAAFDGRRRPCQGDAWKLSLEDSDVDAAGRYIDGRLVPCVLAVETGLLGVGLGGANKNQAV